MNKKIVSILCVTVLYTTLFYQQHVGINFLLFTLAAIAFFYFQDKEAFKSKSVLLLSGAAIFSASFAAVHGSYLSMWATIVSMLVLPGVIINRRSALLIDFFSSLYTTSVSSVYLFIDAIETRKSEKGKGFLSLLKYIVPTVFVIAFFFIYRAMNPLFEKFTQDIAEIISLGFVFFTLGGFLLVYSFYKQKRIKELDTWENNWLINIDQEKSFLPKWNESLSFIILFVILNMMLVAVNSMDINYLYIGNGLPEGIDHKQFVHKGVGMLILSIVLGISILLFFFRGSLNFTKNKNAVKALAFLWVVQNVFMVFSTAIRNTMYVDASLLTYKRIGVYFWLFFAVIGLITLFIKLQRNKTVWFLARHNVSALFVVLLLSSAVDWDYLISSFNLNRAHQMKEISALDKNYMLSLSEGNIEGLFAIKKLSGFEVDSVYSYQDKYLSNTNWLDCKVYNFLLDDAEGDWRSYSVRRNRVRNEIKHLHDNGLITKLELQNRYLKSLSPIYSLNKLEELNLNSNHFNTKEKLAEINHLQQLKKLYLNNNSITDLSALKGSINLTHLSLEINEIDNLNFLKNYPNLDSLELSGNSLITLSSLPALPNLTNLRLDNNPLNDISTLNKLPRLTHLSLNTIVENCGKFPELANLENLSVNGSPNLVMYGLNTTTSFPSLTYLEISNNELTGLYPLLKPETGLSKAPQLKALIISSNKLDNLYGIEQFEQLEHFDARNNSIYNLSGLEKLTKLQRLYLSNNKLNNLAPLAGMVHLKELDLGYNSSIQDFNVLSNFNQLIFLDLSGTVLKDLQFIEAKKSLKTLNLTGCRINNWELLNSFNLLENLSVSYLKKEDVALFKKLTNLKYLHITNTEEEVVVLMKEALKEVEVY